MRGRDLGALGAGSVALGEVWEVWERDPSLWATCGRSGSGISILGELWELWRSSGRGVGVLGAGFVALGEVWEPWELDFVVPVKVWELQELTMSNEAKILGSS